ncbi:DUF7683 domain-containing protein [Agrobacterium pusense]|uniref:DUF7683 domain-containing protein n=1 Tax=Agrobacterium pusense TaxID=648995 RepID=UPI003F6936A7
MNVCLVVEIYEKKGRNRLNVLQLEESNLQFFRTIMNVPDDDPYMYNSYKVDKKSNYKIFEKYGFMVDIDNYDCFVGYVAV